MEKLESLWYMTVLIALFATTIVITYAILIYRSIKRYNIQSLQTMKQYQDLKNMQEKMLLESEVEVREHTFQYISREIHDNITQSLSLANLTLNCIEIDEPIETKKQIDKTREQIRKALNDLNNLSKSLDSDIIESHGIIQAIEFEIERWERISDIRLLFLKSGQSRHLESKKELILFRIIQESVNNVIKHANASTIKITLDYSEQSLTTIISDDGTGFNPEEVAIKKVIGKMAGLRNMRQRAEIIEGTFEILSKPEEGTSVIIEIPI